ncbi:hypothetical protein NIES4071_86720 [Calothrix sp. NIES-4071]|nr:hypothetical protein NIES4071_86720 [Calothrix sp. NIES-4071]BAZ62939.1 hypothetical protein NIES4105_86650 [Calothrix sp. NIES-4105]
MCLKSIKKVYHVIETALINLAKFIQPILVFLELFILPKVNLNHIKLLFGDNITGEQGKILAGLLKGGVYKRHKNLIFLTAVSGT